MRVASILVASAVSLACGAARDAPANGGSVTPAHCPTLRPVQLGSFTSVTPPETFDEPNARLVLERDVLLPGQTPVADFYAEAGFGVYRDTPHFELVAMDGSALDRSCVTTPRAMNSSAYAALDFSCQRPASPGLFRLVLDAATFGLNESSAWATLRVVAEVPPTPAAPRGWTRVALATETRRCYAQREPAYDVRVEAGSVVIAQTAKRLAPALPQPLAARMSAQHAADVSHVFEDDEGWLVLFDSDEFSGGVEWYARSGGSPRPVVVGKVAHDFVSQNVTRAMTIDGSLYALQGLAHLGLIRGQLAVSWREHDHFTSHVIATFQSKPIDWLVLPEGGWLVATSEAIWRVTGSWAVARLTRLPAVFDYYTSLTRTPDGTLYVGGKGGVLRLTPRWSEEPRYVPEVLLRSGSDVESCWQAPP